MDFKHAIRIVCIFFVLTIIGCGSPQVKHSTPSGKPEVIIMGADVDIIASEIINRMINFGYGVTKTDNRMLVFEKPIKSFMGGFLYGSQYDSQPNARISYTLNHYKNETRVVASCDVVTNPGSSFERISNLDSSPETIKLQDMLNEIKASLESKSD